MVYEEGGGGPLASHGCSQHGVSGELRQDVVPNKCSHKLVNRVDWQ